MGNVRVMSTALNVAEQSANLCAYALAAAAGGAASGSVAGPAAVLGLAGVQWLRRRHAACVHTTIRNAVRSLEDAPEFAPHLPRASQLLTDHAPEQPPRLTAAEIRAMADGDAAVFARRIAEDQTAQIPFQPEDETPREIILMALTVTAQGFLSDRAVRDGINDTMLTEVMRDVGGLRQQVDAHAAAQAEAMRKLMAQVGTSQEAERLRAVGVREGVIVGFAERSLAATPDDLGQAWAEVRRLLEVALDVQREGRAGSNHGDFVDAVLARVAELSREGAYGDAGEEIEAALAREEAESRARSARLLDSAVEVATLAGDAPKVAALALRRAELDGPLAFDALRALQDEWYVRGRDRGVSFDLAVSIALARTTHARAADADRRGAALNDLGISLGSLGERETGTGRLEEAVAAYRAALEERTRERVPLDWARTQMNLGIALWTLGERETGTGRLEEAVAAYRAALEETTRDRVPLDWAATIGNEGLALLVLAERTGEVETARRALDQLRTGEVALREGGHDPWADTFARQIPQAEALLDRLSR
jgi:tetratricopeptide (TPR) repeat protein